MFNTLYHFNEDELAESTKAELQGFLARCVFVPDANSLAAQVTLRSLSADLIKRSRQRRLQDKYSNFAGREQDICNRVLYLAD